MPSQTPISSLHIVAITIIMLGSFNVAVVAQPATSDPPARDQAEASGNPSETQDVSLSDQAVAVDERAQVEDRPIAHRLKELLVATRRFNDPTVRVEDGVVFLAGTASDNASKQLAGDLARRTEGVAVVVNNMTLRQGPVWTLEPAAREIENLTREIVRALPLIGFGLMLLTLSLLLAGVTSRAVARLFARSTPSELLQNVVRKAVYLLVVLTGTYLFLRISGLTRVALTVASGTGLLGLTLGFAFRDIAENFLASILLSIQRPFQLGDVIHVDGHIGVVQKVTSRGTLLIDFDGNHIQLANATIYKNTIKNFTANPNVRTDFTVGIGYDTDAADAQEVIRQTLRNHPAVLEDPATLVLVERLGAATVNLRVYFWINGSRHSLLKVKSAVLRQTLVALDTAGVSMPDEAREVIFPQGVPVAEANRPTPIAAMPENRQTKALQKTAASATQAEDGLDAETSDLQRQADNARDPETGSNVLKSDVSGAAGK